MSSESEKDHYDGLEKDYHDGLEKEHFIELEDQIIKNINDMFEITAKIKQGMCDIERNLLIAQDAFAHAKTLTQDQIDLMVT